MSHAVVLLSGGLDSSTALAWAIRQKGWICHALTIAYGQRHSSEIEAAKRVSDSLKVTDHRILATDLRSIGGSALTDDIDVPEYSTHPDEIPVTYVPARNLVFLSLAVAMAETVHARHIVFGANIIDYSGYPDCRPAFLRAFVEAACLGTKAGAEGRPWIIETPLIDMNKSEIIQLGNRLGLDYALTRSCYDPSSDGMPCGRCDSCHFRRQAFIDIGKLDPLPYPGS